MKNLLNYVIIAFLIVNSVFSFLSYRSSNLSGSLFGASTSTYAVALNQQATRQFNDDLVASLAALRAPLAGLVSTSSVAVLPTFNGNVAGNVATSSLSGFSGLSAGDFCMVSVASGTTQVAQSGETITCKVTSASTVLTTFQVPTGNATATAAVTYGLNIRVLPTGSFVAPAALSVSTTTQSAGN